MTKERTSVSIAEVNKEYVDKADINLSELVDKAISRRRLAATKTRPEQLREQIAELEQDREEAKARVRDIEAEISRLQGELKLYEENERNMMDDLLEMVKVAINIAPDDRDVINDQMLSISENAGVTPEQFADCLEYADIHSVTPVGFTSLEALENSSHRYDDERLVVPDELVRDSDKEMESNPPERWIELTENQREAVKQWAREEI